MCKKKCSGIPGKHPGNTRETPVKHLWNTHEMPRKHPGKVHLLMFWIKGASLEKNFFSKNVGIFNKVKDRDSSRKFKNCPVPPHQTIDLHSCNEIPFELSLKKFFFLNLLLWTKTLVNAPFLTFPGCFPGVSRVFPGPISFFLFYFVKSPQNFC